MIFALLAAGLTYVAPGTPVRWTVTPPAAGWTAAAFDDHGWTEATTPLVGDGRVDAGNPVLPATHKLPGSAMTVFVRAHFHVGGEKLRSLALHARFAEGMVAWVDGVEIARRYVAPGAAPADPATQIHGPEPESFVAAAHLAPGEHVLALEVHGHKPGLGPMLEATLEGYDDVRIVRGPYLVRPGAGEMTVAWDTDLDAPGEVRYGSDGTYGKSERSALPVRHHALRLRGLKPGRVYHYSVLAGATDSGDATFHTLPAGDEPIRFVVYGDTRNGHEIHARLEEQVIKDDPDFVLTLGDLVDRGSEESDWQRYFQVSAPLLRVLPIVPALGNHEVYRATEGLAHWLEVFPPPAGAPEPGYYAFDAAGVHFTILDSNQLRSPRQLAWCEQDLARAAKARARFVAMHDGPWSAGFHGGSSDAVRAYVPLFQKYGVSMVFSGHDHDYERGRQLGVDYIVSGGGGAPLYPPRCGMPGRAACPPSTIAITPEYHYVLVEVHRDDYRICPKHIDGTALEPCVDLPVRRPRQ